MKKLILLIGNIGSGKSTLAKKYANKSYRVISRDSIRYMVGAGKYVFNIKLEPIIKKGTLAILREFLKANIDIVYDEVNINKQLRKSTIKLAKKYGYKITAIELPKLSKKVSVKRRLKNPHGNSNKETWNAVWEMFDYMYEKSTKSEGIDEIIRM